jgi:virulence factor
MQKTRIAMIGAGGMANSVHYPSLAEMDDVEFAGICDLNEERLTQTADKYEIEKRFADYKRMVEETAPDAVYVIMPPHHLFDVVVWCLEQEQNVFIEKPPAVNTYQTNSMATLAEKQGVKTMVAFNRRFIPVLVKAKKIVEERGEITQCIATFYKNHLSGGPYYGGAIDILSCDAVHAVDTLRWMGGDVEDVASVIGSYHLPFDCAFNAVMRFESGATGVLLTNWSVGTRVHTFELHSKGISAYVDGNTEARIYADSAEEPTVLSNTEVAGSEESHHYYGFFGENRHFIDCLRNDEMPMPSFSDAVKTMELVDRIYASEL